jgi:putative ABC transport system substrate-binding protein
MRRREFITLLGGAAAWPLATSAQQPAMPVVGYLYSGAPDTGANYAAVFRKGLSESGFAEGQNVAIEYRWAHNDPARLPELAADLVRRRVAVIVAPGTPDSVLAAKAATATIPIVFRTGGDPVQLGFVASLNRPGGNVTGIGAMSAEIGSKRVGLLHELLPAKFGLQVTGIEFKDYPYDYERALAQAPPEYRRFLIATTSPFFARDRARLAEFTLRHQIASMFVFREYVDLGGLMSYGPSREAMSRRTADYVNRIARGAKPSDLPVEAPTRFETVINLKTAKALGLDFSQAMLLRADEVIE